MSVLYVRDRDGKLIPVPAIQGADGYSPKVEISKAEGVTTLTITDAVGIHTASIYDGKDGAGTGGAADPALTANVDALFALTEMGSGTSRSVNLNDGVLEYGRFAAAGTEYNNDVPLEGAFRNANYLAVQGGRTIAVWFAAAEWNNNNVGYPVEVVQYDSGRNICVARTELLPHAATNRPVLKLNANTAYIRLDLNRSGKAIGTPLNEIQIGVYYVEDFVWEYIPYQVSAGVLMIRRDKVSGLEPLAGKKIVYDGDSICESRTDGIAANGGGYAKCIAEFTGGTYTNLAVGGARLCTGSEKHSVVDNLENLPGDGDLYCFEGGINDFWANTQIGECTVGYGGAVDKGTVCGAMETIFRYMLTRFPDKPVCFVIPHKIGNTAYTPNANGDTFQDYRDAMVKVCEKYSVPYYDAFSRSGLNGWNSEQSAAYLTANSSGTGDGIHPNAEGYRKYYVPQMMVLFRGMIPVE